MSVLYVRIDRQDKSATFSGPGTFQAKDAIKELGAARWNPANKEWKIQPFTLSDDEVIAIFPNAEISLTSASIASEPEERERPPKPAQSRGGGSDVPQGVSVSQLMGKIRGALRSALPGSLFVYGVLVSVKEYGPQRVYMELADDTQQDMRISCVIWNQKSKLYAELAKLNLTLEVQLQVMFEVEAELSQRDGRVSLRVLRVVPEYTLGKLAALREQTNERLRKEGLFDRNREATLPFLPRRLGILTSKGGTVIHDFRSSLDEAKFNFDLWWLSVSVQGSEAKAALAQGIQTLAARGDLDAILLFRGGGSPAELAVFNEYEVARAICLCPLPVFSAIGHQEDQSSAQDVSFKALGVPKDVGRFFADIVLNYRRGFHDAVNSILRDGSHLAAQSEERFATTRAAIVYAVGASISRFEEQCDRFVRSIPALGASIFAGQRAVLQKQLQPLRGLAASVFQTHVHQLGAVLTSIDHRGALLVERAAKRCETFVERIMNSIARQLEVSEHRLAAIEARVSEASPETQLRRGFALVQRGEVFVREAALLQQGDQVQITFFDGKKTMEVR